MLKSIPDMLQEIRSHLRCLTAAEAIAELQTNGGILVDVREPEEAKAKPTPSTLNMPRGLVDLDLADTYPDPDQVIYLHCATGVRASFAAEQLLRVGYKNVTVITCRAEEVSKAFEA